MLLQKGSLLSASKCIKRSRYLCQLHPSQAHSIKEMSSVVTRAGKEPRVLVPIGTGSEEIEAVTIIDVLRRAGAEVVVASVESSKEVTCSRGVKIVADRLIQETINEAWDMIALPGGMPGAERLRDSAPLGQLLSQQVSSGQLYAAMCATPAVLLEAKGFLKGRKATAHPAFADKLSDASAVEQRVVEDGPVITSRGPGTSLEFALALVKKLYGEEKAKAVAAPMVVHESVKI